MKLLNGSELAGFIKERHAKQVRQLRARGIKPKLAIIQVKDDPVINTYVRLKQQYGADIAVDVKVHRVKQPASRSVIQSLNTDSSVHGIIVQLPLQDPSQTDDIVNLVIAKKDVDGLGIRSEFEPATPLAIMWLLNGYNVDFRGKRVLLIGRGKLVGAPLEKILKSSGQNVESVERDVGNLAERTKEADIIITAAGSPAILFPDMIKPSAVVVDAGVASEAGKTVGDLDSSVYERDDLTITPQKGGVGPLTVCALFENVIRAAQSAKSAMAQPADSR